MSNNVQISFLLTAVLALTGCKTWYRTGADGEDLARDQQRCETQTGSPRGTQFVECMERSGWSHMNLSAPGSGAEPDGGRISIAGHGAAQPATRTDKVSPYTPTERGVTSGAPGTTTGSRAATGIPDPDRSPGLWLQRGAVAEPLAEAQADCDTAGVADDRFYQCMRAKGWGRLRLSVEEPDDLD